MKFKIGNVEIPNQLVLAPMAGYTNEAFFYVARKCGAGLLCSEMISDKGLIYRNDKTINMLKFDESLHPFSVQLFGNDPISMGVAASIVEKTCHPDIIDINMGCSVPKIYNNGSGCALMKDPNLVYEIVKAVKEAVSVPVTVKIRSGVTHDKINYVEIAKSAEMAGCSAITLHPRTKSDLFNGVADWSEIKNLKEAVSVPVIGSGDIKTPEDALRMLKETGCDAVMIGRSALGNPFIFKQISEYLDTGSYFPITDKEKFDTMIEHYNYLVSLKGEHAATLEMRTNAAWYVKGMKNAVSFKKQLDSITTKEQFLALVDNFKKEVFDS